MGFSINKIHEHFVGVIDGLDLKQTLSNSDILKLNNALDEVYASNEFKSFNRKVGNIRKLVNSSLAQLVKAYPAER